MLSVSASPWTILPELVADCWGSSQRRQCGSGSHRLCACDAQPRKDRPDGAPVAAVSDAFIRRDLGGMPHTLVPSSRFDPTAASAAERSRSAAGAVQAPAKLTHDASAGSIHVSAHQCTGVPVPALESRVAALQHPAHTASSAKMLVTRGGQPHTYICLCARYAHSGVARQRHTPVLIVRPAVVPCICARKFSLTRIDIAYDSKAGLAPHHG